jgi:hypothetical protein
VNALWVRAMENPDPARLEAAPHRTRAPTSPRIRAENAKLADVYREDPSDGTARSYGACCRAFAEPTRAPPWRCGRIGLIGCSTRGASPIDRGADPPGSAREARE